MRYAFIKRYQNGLPIVTKCLVLKVSVSGYGQYLTRLKKASGEGPAPT